MDTGQLIEQLLRPQDVDGGRSLVTPKAAGLVALLCEYKVGLLDQCKPAGSWQKCLDFLPGSSTKLSAPNRGGQLPNGLSCTGVLVPYLCRI